MRINLRAQLHFLDLVGVLVLLGFFFLLGEFVTILAKIHEAANGRCGRRGDFNQIHAGGARLIKRIAQRQNADHLFIDSDDSHFAGTDFPIDPDE